MINCIRKICAVFALGAAVIQAGAQEVSDHNISVWADMMQRGELRIGGNSAQGESDSNLAAFVIGRTRIGAAYKWKDRIEAHLTAQHSGTWGTGDGSLSVYEAWAQLNFGKGFFVKLGRQPVSYDDERIFGSDDWSMTGSTHDALKLGYEGFGHKVHVLGAFNQNPQNIAGGTYYTGGIQPYKTMQALWYHFDVPAFPLGISLIAMNVGMQGGDPGAENERVWWQQLVGGSITYSSPRLEMAADYYRQLGYEEHGLPLMGWMASAKVSFRATDFLALRAGYDYLSGDQDFNVPPEGMFGMARQTAVRGFSSLYGSHHKFYGAMDFFYVSAYYGGFTPGLQNAYIGVNAIPVKGLNLDLAYHFLATSAKLQNAGQALGHEVEFAAGYDFNPFINLSLGYSFMYGTDTMVVLKRTSDKRMLNWAWLMLRITPRFERNIHKRK